MTDRLLICEECGGPCNGRDADGCAICADCALETYDDLESLLDIALSEDKSND
jgi:hypothetical protein